jgi:uncharacterized protein
VKFLLVFLVVLLVAWRWRAWREVAQRDKRVADRAKPSTTEMVLCRHCGVHIPVNEAVVGVQGNYCSAAHRLAREP